MTTTPTTTKARQALIQALDKADKIVTHYRNDLNIDRETLEKEPELKRFIHIARTHGTHMFTFSLKGYPKKGERTRYLFGTSTREEILKAETGGMKHIFKAFEVVLVQYYDGHKLRVIQEKDVASIMDAFYNETITNWEKED